MKIETWYGCTSGYGLTLNDCTEDELKSFLLSIVDKMYDYLILNKHTKDIIDYNIWESTYDYSQSNDDEDVPVPDYDKDTITEYLTKFITNESVDHSYDFAEWPIWNMFESNELYHDHCDQCGDYSWAREYDLNVY